MLPPIEFSIGSRPCEVFPAATEANTSSKCSHETVSTPGHARCAAISLYAPGAPWKAIRMVTPGKNDECTPFEGAATPLKALQEIRRKRDQEVFVFQNTNSLP